MPKDQDRATASQPTTGEGAPANHPRVAELSPEDERRVGLEVHALIVARHKVVEGEALQHRLAAAAAPLVALRPGNAAPVSFTILDSEEIFTFSHPGGYLYASRGLFNFVRNDVELQFILGVELAHLDLRHLEHEASRAAADPGEAAPGPAPRLYRQIALGYTEEQVYEADAWAYRALRRLGQPWYKAFSWLSPLYDFNGEKDPRGTRRIPTTSPLADRQEVENHWSTHPPAAERFNRLRSLVATTNS
jgi:predicted Zn-dependent protease